MTVVQRWWARGGWFAPAFVAVVDAQLKAVSAMKPEEVDARTFGKAMAALRAANDKTVKLPFEA